ncbi:recombinase family protein [Flavobacterium sp.]|uniref:recombinase family protein n=1 Tax=Flavobacterium sp. TaxID=239 RepID=UPI0039E3F8DF
MNFNNFKKFLKTKEIITEKIKTVWGYTRVSSKEQFNNFSLEDQQTNIKEFAKNNQFQITNMLGGTYESASGDFTRKEFTKLIEEIKKSKNKPYAIAIRTINRFSRSGGNAITIVNELVDKLGVHIIETSSGLCSDNEYQKLEIFKKLLEARKENLDRLKLTLPGMKSFLEKGNWLGKAPIGYIIKGKKVTDFSRMQGIQEIVLTDEGKHIKKAWQWKLAGERDFIIRQKLEALGVNISKQKISQMWQKPFYCGVSVNNLLDQPVKGKWQAMISEEDFLKIQNQIDCSKPTTKKEYSKSKVSPERPLTGFLKCICGTPLTSYPVIKKNLHYYKCQICKNASFNAHTTKKSSAIGLNNLFEELLLKYNMSDEFVEPFKKQLNKIFNVMNQEGYDELEAIKEQLKSKNNILLRLEKKYIENIDFSDEAYNRMKKDYMSEIDSLTMRMENAQQKISNHNSHINSTVEVIKNISKIWASGDVENKLRVQNLVFPEGLSINPKNRQYLTNKVNRIFSLTLMFTGETKGEESKKPTDDVDGSYLVAGTGLEPVTFGL